MDKNEAHLNEALKLGLVDDVAQESDLQNADLVCVSVPVNKLASVLPQVLNAVGEHTIVFDTGSTKEKICAQVADHPKRGEFLACHPIAGTEFSGPAAAVDGLFEGKRILSVR